MRSSRSWIAALLGAVAVVATACGNDVAYDCAESPLTYQTFGEPFVANWCRGCHSTELYPTMRQDAPLDVNLDTLDDVRRQKDMIRVLAVDTTAMPPAGGPSDEERALLREWLACGAR